MKEPTDQRYVSGIANRLLLNISRTPFDSAQRNRQFAIIDLRSAGPDLGEHRRDFPCESLRRKRGGSVLVEHTPTSGLQRRRHCRGGLRDIFVDQAAERVRSMTGDDGMNQEEQLMLPLGQVVDCRHEDGDIPLLLPFHNRGRMLTGRDEMWAGVGALNFHQPLGATADRADATPQRGAVTPPLSSATRWAGHKR
jgi:hypothetical protein